MISAKMDTAVAILALAGTAFAQGKEEDQGITELIAQLENDSSADRAMAGLLEEGRNVALALGKCVAAGKDPARSRALLVLRQLGTSAVEAMPHILSALELCDVVDAHMLYDAIAEIALIDFVAPSNSRERLRRATDRLLQTADGKTGRAIRHGFVRARTRMQFAMSGKDALSNLRDKSAIAREYGAELAGINASKRFLPALQSLLKYSDRLERGRSARAFGEELRTSDRILMKAAWAIERITGEQFENVHRHRYWLRYGGLPKRIAAILVLAQNPVYAQQSLLDLIGALSDSSPRVVAEATTALGLIGPAAADAIPALEKLSRMPDGQISARAKAALRQIH